MLHGLITFKFWEESYLGSVLDSFWFVLTRVGSCWLVLIRVDSFWLVLTCVGTRVGLCWYLCIKIDLTSKTRSTSCYQKHYLLQETILTCVNKVWKLNVKKRSVCMTYCKLCRRFTSILRYPLYGFNNFLFASLFMIFLRKKSVSFVNLVFCYMNEAIYLFCY